MSEMSANNLTLNSKRTMKAVQRKPMPETPPDSPAMDDQHRSSESTESSSLDENNTAVPGRPDLSYAHLAALAIDASGRKRCTVGEIYSWIEANYPFYKSGCPWWKNCIRHNLSMKRCFVRIKSDGVNMWAINPAHYDELLHSKRRRTLSSSNMVSNVPTPMNVVATPTPSAPTVRTIVSYSPNTPSTSIIVAAPPAVNMAPHHAPSMGPPLTSPTVSLSHGSMSKRAGSPKASRSPRRPRRSAPVSTPREHTHTAEPTLMSLRGPVDQIWLVADRRSPSPLNAFFPVRTGSAAAQPGNGFASICAVSQRSLFSSTPETMDRFLSDNWFSLDCAQPC